MSRKLDIKNGDKVFIKIEEGSNAARRKEPFSLETFDEWVKEVEVTSVGRKYITVGKEKYSQIKFEIENDYREHYTCGGADHKLYVSKQEILDEHESNQLYDGIKSCFSNWVNNDKYSLDQLRRIKAILEE